MAKTIGTRRRKSGRRGRSYCRRPNSARVKGYRRSSGKSAWSLTAGSATVGPAADTRSDAPLAARLVAAYAYADIRAAGRLAVAGYA